jgi:acetate kinase
MRAILSVNAGSSSLKLALFDADTLEPLARGAFDGLAAGAKPDAVVAAIGTWAEREAGGATLVAASHRVVHGGAAYAHPVLVSRAVLHDLEALVPLAPLHQPASLAPIRALSHLHPFLKQVACFDTAFHRGRPSSVERYALPSALFDEGIRRYGFHGLSYEYVAWKLREVAPEAAAGRVVALHLGNGASLCAMKDGKCVDTTMGFSTLDGLAMGTRCGALDPGVVFHLLREGRSVADVERLLYRESGLLGVSGIDGDLRVLLASAEPSAREAVDVFVWSIVRSLGAMTAMLGGLDALVFTAGIGEHSPEIRGRVARAMGWTGLVLDDAANAAPTTGAPTTGTSTTGTSTTRLSAPASPVSAWVVPTDEAAMLARHARAVLAGR